MATDLRRPPAALDSGSFDRFYRRHLSEIYRFVLQDVGNRAEAEEVTQTAFLDAFRALRRGHEPEMPRAWMYGIARNATRRRYRTLSRRPREVELEAATVDELAQPDEGPWAEAVRTAFARLRPNYRDVLFLREVEGLSYVEIAARLNLSQSAVETLLFRARRALREHLEAEGLTPSVRPRRLESLKALTVLPAAFLGRLSDRFQQLVSPEVAAKAAGAVTAVALGTGMAVGTKALPVGTAAQASEAPRAAAAGGDASWSASTTWHDSQSLVAPRPARAEPRVKAERKGTGDGRKDGEGRRGDGAGTGGNATQGPSEGRGSSSGGDSGGGSSGGGLLSTPAVSIPSVQVPALPSVPQVSTPVVDVPAVEVGGDGGLLGG